MKLDRLGPYVQTFHLGIANLSHGSDCGQVLGVFAKVESVKRGYYPKGGGKVVLHIEPKETLSPLQLEDLGGPLTIKGISHVSNLPDHIPERMVKSAKKDLIRLGRPDIVSKIFSGDEAFGQGVAKKSSVPTRPSMYG